MVLAWLLGGCGLATITEAERATEAVEGRITSVRPSPPVGPGFSTVRVVDHRPYVGIERRKGSEGPRLPDRFLGAEAVTLPLNDVGSEAVLAGRIQTASGLAVSFVGEAVAEGEEEPGRRGLEMLGAAGGDHLSAEGGIWTGPLPALLDAWTKAAGYDWRYVEDEERIEILRERTVVFRIHALAGQQVYAASASTEERGGTGGDVGSNQLANQSITTETTYDHWPEIDAQIRALVGEEATVAVAPSSASVMVRGRPADIVRVRRFLAYLNREVLRPVTVSVYVYSVQISDETDYDVGLSFLVSRLLGGSVQLSVNRDTVSVIRPADVVNGVNTLNATVEALNQAGRVSRVLSADVPSLNGKPAQFFELFNQAYLKETRTTLSEGISQTNLVPGRVSSGFAVSYLPRITGPDEVLVRLFASVQDRPSFTVFSSADQSIQLPAFGSRAIKVTQRIRRGETLMVTGFSDRGASRDRSGTFDAAVPLPEGRGEGRLARAEQVLLVTAEIGAPLGIGEEEGTGL